MLIRKPSDIPSSEITSKSDYMNRRNFIAGAAAAGALAVGADRVAQIIEPDSHVLADTAIRTS